MVAVLVLLVFLFNMTGVYILFKVEQTHIRKSIKHQIKANIPIDQLHKFVLSHSSYKELNWIRPNIEFRMGNDMYDIVHLVLCGDSIQLQCVNDKEEAILFAKLDELLQKKMEQESNTPSSPINKVMKKMKLVYIKYANNISLINKTTNEAFKIASIMNFYCSPYLEIQCPPPDSV